MADTALIVVDLQNDFCPGGALGVDGGDEIIPFVNEMMRSNDHVILTQEWHPTDHFSFASSHDGPLPYDSISMPYGQQTLWPDHCIRGSTGAEFHPALDWTQAEMVIRKGFRTNIDSYSAFYENDRTTPTGLGGYLRERGIRSITLVGIATDFCVAYSALDAIKLGFLVAVRLDACRAIDLNGSLDAMVSKMRRAGVVL